MRAYHFFMKFRQGFLLGFRSAWLVIFILAAVLAAMYYAI